MQQQILATELSRLADGWGLSEDQISAAVSTYLDHAQFRTAYTQGQLAAADPAWRASLEAAFMDAAETMAVPAAEQAPAPAVEQPAAPSAAAGKQKLTVDQVRQLPDPGSYKGHQYMLYIERCEAILEPLLPAVRERVMGHLVDTLCGHAVPSRAKGLRLPAGAEGPLVALAKRLPGLAAPLQTLLDSGEAVVAIMYWPGTQSKDVLTRTLHPMLMLQSVWERCSDVKWVKCGDLFSMAGVVSLAALFTIMWQRPAEALGQRQAAAAAAASARGTPGSGGPAHLARHVPDEVA